MIDADARCRSRTHVRCWRRPVRRATRSKAPRHDEADPVLNQALTSIHERHLYYGSRRM